MSEQLTAQPNNISDTPNEAGLFRRAYSILDLSAGVTLRSGDVRLAQETMTELSDRFGGLLERQSATDVLSMALADDVMLDFRRDAQRAGFTNVDTMPQDLRNQIAQSVAESYFDDFKAELRQHHPDWTNEQLMSAAEARAQDVITLLNLDSEQRDEYQAAMFEYRQKQAELTQLQIELEAMRQERNTQCTQMGRIAVEQVVTLAGKVRTLPYAVGSRLTVAAMRVGEWYHNKSPEGKKTMWSTAAGVAVAGLVGYIAVRSGRVPGQSNLHLAANSMPDGSGAIPVPANQAGNIPHSADVAGLIPKPQAVAGNIPHPGDVAGNIPRPQAAAGVPVPGASAGNIPHPADTAGYPRPGNVAGNMPTPENAAGNTVTDTKDLFVHKVPLDKWPATITVSAWDPKTHDGSLIGISTEMWRRSGVTDPSSEQINQLVHVLRPQAQPNGYLLKGQTLNLKPALDILRQKS